MASSLELQLRLHLKHMIRLEMILIIILIILQILLDICVQNSNLPKINDPIIRSIVYQRWGQWAALAIVTGLALFRLIFGTKLSIFVYYYLYYPNVFGQGLIMGYGVIGIVKIFQNPNDDLVSVFNMVCFIFGVALLHYISCCIAACFIFGYWSKVQDQQRQQMTTGTVPSYGSINNSAGPNNATVTDSKDSKA